MIGGNKKSSGHSYSWRPNFRNYEELPDLRTVRTQFFLPAVALAVAAVAAVLILMQELRSIKIKGDIETLEGEIASYQVRHDEKVDLNAEFINVTRTIDEVLEFKGGKLIGSDFLLSLSSNLIEGMYLSRIEYRENEAIIEGRVQVEAAEASKIVNHYLAKIEQADALQGKLSEYKLTRLARDKEGDMISFRIEVTGVEEAKK